jgi:hypothetical protein
MWNGVPVPAYVLPNGWIIIGTQVGAADAVPQLQIIGIILPYQE